MAAEYPTTIETRVRFWTVEGEYLWSSVCDPPELAEEIRLELAERLTDHEWMYATIDYAIGDGDWRRSWAGRMRLDGAGEVELRPAIADLPVLLHPDNPELLS